MTKAAPKPFLLRDIPHLETTIGQIEKTMGRYKTAGDTAKVRAEFGRGCHILHHAEKQLTGPHAPEAITALNSRFLASYTK